MTAPLTAFDNDGLRFGVHDWAADGVGRRPGGP